MEFPFDLAEFVGAPEDHDGPCVGYIDEEALHGPRGHAFSRILEVLGQKSAEAQGLGKPVTYGSPGSLGDQRVYLLVDNRVALGFLKVGSKRLFVAAPVSAAGAAFPNVQNTFREIEPLCVLDIYVHERHRRSGHGRRLFDAMLGCERAKPAELAYDRPSPKLLSFMDKHYGLCKFMPQSNNFVVFDAFFQPDRSPATPLGRAQREREEYAADAWRTRPHEPLATPGGSPSRRPCQHGQQGIVDLFGRGALVGTTRA